MSKCYVYLIQSGKGYSKPIKIGMANNPQQRISELQTGNPDELKIIATIPCDNREQARKMEAYLHSKLSCERIRGEWFRSKSGSINRLLKEMSENTDTFDYEKTTNTRGMTDAKSAKIRSLKSKSDNKSKMIKEAAEANRKLKKQKRVMRDKLFDLGMSWDEIDNLYK